MTASRVLPQQPGCDFPLFVPADRPDRLAKAIELACDAVIVDLEDAVAPADRLSARMALTGNEGLLRRAGVPVFVRVNGVGSPWHEEDVAACSRLPIAGVMLPKSESGAALDELRAGLPGFRLVALVETAAGLAGLRQWACKADRVAFGAIDYSADIGCVEDRTALLGARQEIVLASRLAGLPAPIDGVTTAVRDADLVRSDAEHAMRLGFGGKLLIHPDQIAPALEGFAPSGKQRQWAERILAAGHGGATSIDGEMIDAPVLAKARNILARVRTSRGKQVGA